MTAMHFVVAKLYMKEYPNNTASVVQKFHIFEMQNETGFLIKSVEPHFSQSSLKTDKNTKPLIESCNTIVTERFTTPAMFYSIFSFTKLYTTNQETWLGSLLYKRVDVIPY